MMEPGGRDTPSRTAALGSFPPQAAIGYSNEEQVMSEVHLGCPPNKSGPHITRFTISLPNRDESIEDSLVLAERKVVEVDEDGDLVVPRRNPQKESLIIKVQHNITSSIPKVGLQIWRAELVLADFVLHMMCNSSKFNDIIAVELGAGTGLVGILLARVANIVFITDRGDEVLENCVENVRLNARIFHNKSSVCVRELDWNSHWPPEVIANSPSSQSYGWTQSEVEEVQRASLLIAADVIYSDDLTDAFFNVLESIMSSNPEKVLYLALEKRYNFTIDDLDVVANGYSHFRSYITDEEDNNNLDKETSCSFIGRRINLEEIPQYVQGYERGKDVEIWQIKHVNGKPLI